MEKRILEPDDAPTHPDLGVPVVLGATDLEDAVQSAGPQLAARALNASKLTAKAWEARNSASQTAAFLPRDFVTFGLPLRRHPGPTYTRRNGPYELIITAPEYDATKKTGGIPYAQDRLVIVFLTTLFKLAGSPASNAVAFPTASTPLELLALPKSGNATRRFAEGVARVHAATYLGYDTRKGYRKGDRYQLLSRYKFWFDRDTRSNQYTLKPNILDFDPRFAADIRNGAIPFDLETARALKNNLAAFDLYTFETYRSYLLQTQGLGEVEIDIFGDSGLLAQLGSAVDKEHEPKAREQLKRWHGLVQMHWPDCPNVLVIGAKEKRERLVVRAARALTGTTLPRIPGVRAVSRDECEDEWRARDGG